MLLWSCLKERPSLSFAQNNTFPQKLRHLYHFAMKHILTISTLFILSSSLYAQIYIGPRLSWDFTKMESMNTNPQFNIFEITNRGFKINSLVYGVQVEHSVFKHAFMSYYFNYTRKKVDASIFNFLPLDGFVYRYYRNSISLKYIIKNITYLGAGVDYNIITNGRYTIGDNLYDEFIHRFIDYGVHISEGVRYKGFELEGYYYNGFNSNHEKPSGLFLKPVMSIGLSLGYLYKIRYNKKEGA